MKMLVKKIVIPLIFRRQLEMGIDPTSFIKLYIYIYIYIAEFLKTYLKMHQNIRTESWR